MLYLEISCRNDVTNLWLSFSILTKKCVKAQTLNQKKLYNAQKCYPGFLAWNKYWKDCYAVDLKDKNDIDSLSNVDVYYEKWVKECAESAEHSDFQKLWEVLMIRVTSEAICETAGSMMNQHCCKNRFLQPKNLNIEMYLKFNLGPLHLLDNFVKEILASDSSQSYLRKEQAKKRSLVTNDLNKSAAMEIIEKRNEKKSRFPISFWQDTSK